MILALSITLAVLAVLALGIFVYFKFFALVYDKDGMVYQAQGGPHLCNPPHSKDDGPIDGGATDNSDLNAPKSIEIIMTGHNPPQRFIDAADYVTEFKKIKHPFDRGITGRIGVEF